MGTETDQIERLRPAVLRCLNNLLYEKFPKQSLSYAIKEATEKGDNYLGVVYRIKVTFHASDDTEFFLILKVPPTNLVRRKQFFLRPCFLREALAYDEFLPLVMDFQSSKGIALNEGFHARAECYRTITAEMDEAIFLEDLQQKGFKMFDRFEAINVDYVRTVMRIYGQLHAISFAIKDQCPESLRKFQQIEDLFAQRRKDHQLATYFEGLKKSALGSLTTMDVQKYKIVLEQFFAKQTFFDAFLALINGQNCEPYAVVCHGDCWNNNILFKHQDSKVIDACLIDWQIMRYSSPITDLMHYLFTCTTKEFRDHHFEEMLDTYYETLCDHIKRLGSNPTILFPKYIFTEELKKFGAIGLLMAMIILPITTIKKENVPDLEKISEQIEAGGTTDLEGAGFLGETNVDAYNRLLRDVIIDVINLGYI